MKTENNKKIGFSKYSVLVAIFVFGFALHVLLHSNDLHCEEGYSFVNRRVSCGMENIINKKDYVDLKVKIGTLIEEEKSANRLKFASVYFRDLEAGPTFGIDERVDYIPASLLKLPLVLTYFEIAETKPELMEEEVFYDDSIGQIIPNQTFEPSDKLIPNRSYKVKDLIDHSIINSDNVASQLLFDYLDTFGGKELLAETYRNLGILEMGADFDFKAVNAKSYGSIFRMLYNASFLNPELSEELLSLLTRSEFTDGLKAGLPSGVKIAHKFGERYLNSGEKQLHDCGIIYYPQNPYLLCVMTEGYDFDQLTGLIQTISNEVYKEVDSRRIEK